MMKKSSLTALLLGTLSGVLFAIGMCMALIAEWNAFTPGVVLGCAGVVLGIATMLIWRKMEHKAPLRLSGRHVRAVLSGAAEALRSEAVRKDGAENRENLLSGRTAAHRAAEG